MLAAVQPNPIRDTLLTQIRMRPKNQVTLPAFIVQKANIKLDDKLTVEYLNGSIIISPPQKFSGAPSPDVMSYAGIGQGLWGKSLSEVDQSIRALRADR